jgi:hypothetical protein
MAESGKITLFSLYRPNLMQTLEGTPVFVHAGIQIFILNYFILNNYKPLLKLDTPLTF